MRYGMADTKRDLDQEDAPDPSENYERSHPEKEQDGDQLGPIETAPDDNPDRELEAVDNKQDPERSITAEDTVDDEAAQGLREGREPPTRPAHAPGHRRQDDKQNAPHGIRNDDMNKAQMNTQGRTPASRPPANGPPGPADNKPLPQGDAKADHSMNEEEALGWDQAPQEGGQEPMQKRHSKIGGKGGTPDTGEETRTNK